MLPLPSGQRERIGNRVRIPDGTAAVCAEAACRAKAGHWETEKAIFQAMLYHKSGDLPHILILLLGKGEQWS